MWQAETSGSSSSVLRSVPVLTLATRDVRGAGKPCIEDIYTVRLTLDQAVLLPTVDSRRSHAGPVAGLELRIKFHAIIEDLQRLERHTQESKMPLKLRSSEGVPKEYSLPGDRVTLSSSDIKVEDALCPYEPFMRGIGLTFYASGQNTEGSETHGGSCLEGQRPASTVKVGQR